MNAYVADAALICEACATNANRLNDGPHADGGGEADTPQHCDVCGKFLHNPLTADGHAYVRELIGAKADELGLRPDANLQVALADEWPLGEWAAFYGIMNF